MRYRNPPIPAITPPANENREFITLLAAVGALLLVLLTGSALLATWLAPHLPFSAERALSGAVVSRLGIEAKAAHPQRQAALEALTARVVAAMDLPPEIRITVHYVDQPTVNAAATLGGHLLVFRGLIDKLPSEEALAAVLAHEIGHVRERHVIQALGRGVAILAALSAVGVKSQAAGEWLMGESAELTALHFSREAELAADLHALKAVQRLYGNVSGVMELFDLFIAEQPGGGMELWKSHPLPENRRAELATAAGMLGFALKGEHHPVPAALRQ